MFKHMYIYIYIERERDKIIVTVITSEELSTRWKVEKFSAAPTFTRGARPFVGSERRRSQMQWHAVRKEGHWHPQWIDMRRAGARGMQRDGERWREMEKQVSESVSQWVRSQNWKVRWLARPRALSPACRHGWAYVYTYIYIYICIYIYI